ncbi:hypothetical protein HMPREF9450_02278 [Alistipes indistinctus YIT 12060]|uniref:Uncharacterized protein n=2 Tax=Alistipes indistinctus YIT 12060 TaxID=742725 RepID=G5HBG8_9BACT|nr:hypothetical protein HMPREF9450_02278 [Alistipes indistinctus YIT 12060]
MRRPVSTIIPVKRYDVYLDETREQEHEDES